MSNFIANGKMKFILSFVGAQFITFIALPLITRLYSPSQFGVFSYNLAIISLLGYLSCFRLNLILQLEDGEKSLEKRLSQCYLLIAITTFALFIISFLLYGFNLIVSICVISILLLGLYEIHVDYYSSKLNYSSIAKMNVIRTISVVFFQIILSPINNGLIYGFFIGLFISQLYIIFNENRSVGKVEWLSKNDLTFMYKNTGISIVNFIGSTFPLIIIHYFLTSHDVGVYSLADKLLIAIFVVVNNIASRFIFNDLKRKTIKMVFKKWLLILSTLFFIVFLVITLIPSFIFGNIFGREWIDALSIMNCLMPWFSLQLFMIVINCVYIKKQNESKLLWIEGIKNLSRIFTILILIYFSISLDTIILISSTIPLFIVIIFICRDAKNENLFC
ncbi:TPA: lipopolysaccharide biosynthesis protein [Photobacterium damselae]